MRHLYHYNTELMLR